MSNTNKEEKEEDEGEMEYVVQQDDHFFTVLESDIMKFPNSFLAAFISAEKNGFQKSDGVIKVLERNTLFFEYVQQVYKKGSVKIRDENVPKSEVIKELKFWFTDYQIPVSYKDKMFNLVTIRHEYFAGHFAKRRDAYIQTLEKRASMGFLNGSLCSRAEISFPQKDQHQIEQCCAVYARFLSALYPKDEFTLKMSYGSFIATWKLHVGILGKMTERALDERCKRLWKRLFEEAEKTSFSGDCTINLGVASVDYEFFRDMDDIFNDHFAAYVQKKSKYKVDLTWIRDTTKRNTNTTLKLSWGFQVELP